MQAAQEAELDELAAAVEAAEAAAADAERRLREAKAGHNADKQQMADEAAAEEARARVSATIFRGAANEFAGQKPLLNDNGQQLALQLQH